MNTLERIRKGMLLNKDTKEKESSESTNKNENSENKSTEVDIENKTENNESKDKTENNKENGQTTEEQKNKKEAHERKISFSLNKALLPDIKIENSINSLFKLIPTFNVPPKVDEENKEAEENKEPEIIVLDNTDESLKIYQQKMIDLREENNFLKNQIKEYVSKVAWLEEHFTIRQENANVQHLQELEHIRKTNEKETNEYLERIKELEDEVGVLQTELTRQTDLLADEKDTLTFTTSANWNLEKKISELEDKLKIKNSESIDLKAQILNISEQLETKTEQYNEIEKKYNTLKKDSEGFTTEIEKLRKENTLLTEKNKIFDNITKRSSKTLESRLYNNLYSPTTPKTTRTSSEYYSPTTRTNSEYSFNLYPKNDSTTNTTKPNNTTKPDPIDTSVFSFSQTINPEDSVMSSTSYIDNSDLNDLMEEISFSEVQTKKPSKLNIFEVSEPSQELLSEDKDEDLTLNAVTQPQNILTEINLD